MPDHSDDITRWIDKLGDGDQDAAQVIWEQYFNKLVSVARRKMAPLPKRIGDEEDVALSAMHSFCQGAKAGKFPKLEDREDLWKLLVTITIRKVYGQMRYNKAEKRGGGQVRGESVFIRKGGDDSPMGIDQFLGSDPTPEFAAMVSENCDQLLDQLEDETLQKVAKYKLEGLSNDEIAEKLNCVSRTVERKLERIRSKWSQDEEEP